MIGVAAAEHIVLSHRQDYGVVAVPFTAALGRVLAEDIFADRDLPPYDRVTMDGVALRYDDITAGLRRFSIAATQAAGDPPIERLAAGACIEIMTGAVMPPAADTVVPYEHLTVENGYVHIVEAPLKKGQNIHWRGFDRKEGDRIARAGDRVAAAHIGVAASVGKSEIAVRNLPSCVIVSSGDELVDVADRPAPYQIRRSNNYTLQAALKSRGISADLVHIPDNLEACRREIARCLDQYDVVLLSGGVSMGKYDYVPAALEALSVKKHFQKVRQRPGKPFWFGTYADRVPVFAFPGNPVSVFMCFHRYFIPWLEASTGVRPAPPLYAVLTEEVKFSPPLHYFLQVTLSVSEAGLLCAAPLQGNGSGDFANLADTSAFMELPADKEVFLRGEAYRIWPFNGGLL